MQTPLTRTVSTTPVLVRILIGCMGSFYVEEIPPLSYVRVALKPLVKIS
jgi:hypothetical protein